MRNFRLTIAAVALIAFLGIGLSGCGGPTPKVPEVKDVVGKWLAIKKEAYTLGGGQQVGFVMEFFNDKTVMLPSGKGSWEILKDGRVKIDAVGLTMHGSLEKDLLTITMPDNKGKVIFKKQ